MAKDNREILSGIRIGNDVFLPGQEDEVAEKLSAKDGQRLVESGALVGDWSFSVIQNNDAPQTTSSVNPKPVKTDAKG